MEMNSFFQRMFETSLAKYAGELRSLSDLKFKNPEQGDFERWLKAFRELPDVTSSRVDLSCDAISIGQAADLKGANGLSETLTRFHPWRKGPFELFGVLIDSEWCSNLKWNRIQKSIQPLKGRLILDLGCGNGYYLWRMLSEGAHLALGVDPSWLYFFQFQVMQKYIQDDRATVLPLGAEDLPKNLTGFDTVFSMGLLYHRKDPLEHLRQLSNLLRKGGELVLETLVIDGAAGDVLQPGERYAKMRNVWNVPACGTVETWLMESGFENIRCVDITVTTLKEQRKTAWMTFESLDDFLDPKNISQTIEGYPAPKRAIFIAQKSEW